MSGSRIDRSGPRKDELVPGALRRCFLVLALLWLGSAGWFGAWAEASQPVAVTTGDAASRAPAWSPDGARIAFESDRSGTWNLYVLDVATARVERLIPSDANDRQPAWSPDGSRIVFVSDRAGEPDLFVLDLGTERVRRLAVDAGEEHFPSWSPDGAAIVFTRRLADASTIRSLDLETGVTSAVERAGAGIWPRWSPDGTRLAFFSRRDTGGDHDEIYLLERVSGEVVRLTDRPGHDFCPSWSPQGDRLVMVSVESEGSRSLRIVDVSGAEDARLAVGYHRVTEPSWSPDGGFIVYAGRQEGQPYRLFREAVPARPLP